MSKENVVKNEKALASIERMEKYIRGEEEVSKEQEDEFFKEVEEWISASLSQRASADAKLEETKNWNDEEDEEIRKKKILEYMSNHIDKVYKDKK
mgnify:CR=1 FL=1